MKRLLLISALLYSVVINAQEKKSEFDFGVGFVSSNQVIGTLSNVIISGINPNIDSFNEKYYGPYYVGYRYSIANRVSIGLMFIYDFTKADAKDGEVKVGKFNNTYYTGVLELDFKYINTDNFKLYSLIGGGATIYHQKYSEIGGTKHVNSINFANFQFTPIGIKFGDRFGGYLEAGFGYKGILSAGLFLRL